MKKSEKAGLKLNIQKTKIMTSSPVTSWQIDAEIMEIVRDFILGGFKITADSDCRNWKTLAPWKKSYDQPRQHIKKQRHYFSDKGPSSQSYGFSSSHVLMWELDYKETQRQRIDSFELWCWRRLLRVPWTARSNHSILNKTSPEYSLERLVLKLKLNTLATWWEELTHWIRPWCWERLRAKRSEPQKMRWLGVFTDSMDMSLGKLLQIVKDMSGWCAAVHGVSQSWTPVRDWTTTVMPQKSQNAADFL